MWVGQDKLHGYVYILEFIFSGYRSHAEFLAPLKSTDKAQEMHSKVGRGGGREGNEEAAFCGRTRSVSTGELEVTPNFPDSHKFLFFSSLINLPYFNLLHF